MTLAAPQYKIRGAVGAYPLVARSGRITGFGQLRIYVLYLITGAKERGTGMSENKKRNFIVGSTLMTAIESQTGGKEQPFKRRDFVEPLVQFCLNGDYSAKIGVVYGLRSTGKTVGLLQAAETLSRLGHKVAYARFNYERTDMAAASDEIVSLANEGYTHFLVDEAPYLNGFITDSAEWADSLVPQNRIKIVVSGTDSFSLWMSMKDALYHRFVRFSTNRNSYPEFNRVLGMSFEEYKHRGGLFLPKAWRMDDESSTGESTRDDSETEFEHFIESAVVDNLIHTLEHANEIPGGKDYYYDWLYAVDKLVIFKGVIAILESTAEATIRKNFIQDAHSKNLLSFGEAVKGWLADEKRDLRDRVAEKLSVYEEFRKIENPLGSIDALIAFLVKIGCLTESFTGVSDLGNKQKTLYFAHNALMNYALEETKTSILSLSDENKHEIVKGLNQALDGCLNKNVVYFHLAFSVGKDEKVFRYRDAEMREIDAVVVNRIDKIARLYEVKSKSKIDVRHLRSNEAKHLVNRDVLTNIGVDETFKVVRVIVYAGKTEYYVGKSESILLVNASDLLSRFPNTSQYIDDMAKQAEQKRREKYPKNVAYVYATHLWV
jgi:predicted AAA+ superfamily ATPase